MQHSFEDNLGIWQLTEVLKICIRIRFGLCEFFCSCLSIKTNAIKFSVPEDIFSLQTQYFIDEEHTQWNLDIEILLKLDFMQCSERKVSHCILAFSITLRMEVTINIISSDLSIIITCFNHVAHKNLKVLQQRRSCKDLHGLLDSRSSNF